jgi:hypothetical protein
VLWTTAQQYRSSLQYCRACGKPPRFHGYHQPNSEYVCVSNHTACHSAFSGSSQQYSRVGTKCRKPSEPTNLLPAENSMQKQYSMHALKQHQAPKQGSLCRRKNPAQTVLRSDLGSLNSTRNTNGGIANCSMASAGRRGPGCFEQ